MLLPSYSGFSVVSHRASLNLGSLVQQQGAFAQSPGYCCCSLHYNGGVVFGRVSVAEPTGLVVACRVGYC